MKIRFDRLLESGPQALETALRVEFRDLADRIRRHRKLGRSTVRFERRARTMAHLIAMLAAARKLGLTGVAL